MHDDLKQRLRDEVDAELGSRPPRNLSDVLTRGRRKRLALRLVTTISIVLLGTALIAGGFWIAGVRSPSSDDALPPANQGTEDTTESSGDMWPQSSLEEARRAQRLADAGDPRYTWQVVPWPPFNTVGKPAVEPGDVELFTRFLQEKLGWEEFSWGVGPGPLPPPMWPFEFVVVRCAPGETNALYPNDPDGRKCAPTIGENRYETVRISAEPLGRDSVGNFRDSAIWVVTRWEMLQPSDAPVTGPSLDVFRHQIQQLEPLSEAKATEFLRAFLQARVDGEGAEQYMNRDLGPQLYGRYVRFELELVRGPVWPRGWMEFKVRLFAEDGRTVVEQLFVDRGEGGRLVVYQIHSSDEELVYGALS